MNGDEQKAMQRYMIISASRVFGVMMVAVALADIAGNIDILPDIGAYILLVFGIVDFLFMPIFLSKKWKSKPDNGNAHQ